MADWMRLDNAALIFPAVRRKGWSNAFRVSATLYDPVDPVILQQAVDALRPRFPSMYVSLHRGMFWYYLEKLPRSPAVRPDGACPLIHMNKHELRKCCLRVLYYENRIAVECFHALTDGSGGMVFLKTLAAEYVSRRYGVDVPAGSGVLDRFAPPRESELEDSFARTAGPVAMSRKEEDSLRLGGTKEPDGFLHHIIATTPSQALLELAHEYDCSVTSLLSAVMLQCVMELAPKQRSGRWAKVTVPVNLRRLLGGQTLRNFVLTVNVGVDPRLGSYTLRELTQAVQSQLLTQVTPQQMAARVAANVNPSRMLITKIMPLPIKNLALRAVYRSVGESKGTINISNLGSTQLPEAMAPYVRYLDFTIGPQATYYNNCSVVSYNGFTRINLIRSVREPDLARLFLRKLVELGLEITVDSNERRENNGCTV